MDKKIYIEKYPRGEKPHKKVIREFRIDDDCFGEGRHERHEKHGGHEFRHFEENGMKFEGKKHRHKIHVKPRTRNTIMKTKMFISKAELVEYVNSIGDLGHTIDIFKIEDELYKVAVLEKVINKRPKEEEIEIKIKESVEKIKEEIELEVEED